MDWHAALGLFAGVVQISSIIPYIRSMLHGETRPNVVSWALWTLLLLIGVLAQFSAGASWSIILLIASAFNTGLVTILCLWGYGYKKYGLLDVGCLTLALAAIVFWKITNDPVLAIILAVAADFLATVPTIAKTYREPRSESLISWAIIVLASALAIFSTTKLDTANLFFPGYLLLINGFMTALIFFGQRAAKQRRI